MQTDKIEAWQVEEDDLITLGGEATFTVDEKIDNGDSITLVLSDEDGEKEAFSFTADEGITLVVSLEEDE